LTVEHKERYARHLMLEGLGEAGQLKLLKASVLVIGAGGLGSPALYYLVAAGVGRVGIVDSDVVELSNLQRQTVHNTERVGLLKVDSAAITLKPLNPEVRLLTYPFRADADNITALINEYDFVIDATDNFESKFLINDACVAARKAYSHGGILRFNGQTMTVIPGASPCYRCIFPESLEGEDAIACSKAGVLGVLPGVIGTLQATEAIKYLTDVGELLTGRLLTYDSAALKFREIRVRRNPACPACGESHSSP
jgi:molybdopterin/thiamine biosynthesis adenylyltransferase